MSRNGVKTPVYPEGSAPPLAHYTPGILAGNTLYISGQLGMDAAGNLVSQDARAQTAKALENMGAVLKAAGMDYANVVKCTCFLVDMADFAVRIFSSFSTPPPPFIQLIYQLQDERSI
jgi:2-iminobutanoate/2-iminopropanoate deaminase